MSLPSFVSQGSKATKMLALGKGVGIAGAGLGIGLGVWELCKDPNEKCRDCKKQKTANFCKRICVRCSNRAESVFVEIDTNKGKDSTGCQIICG